jgi:O-ureido-D-serine cyclo-ligase
MVHVALVTSREALALDEDMPPLAAALARNGARVSTPSWDDANVDWSQFDVAVLRSTWDYVDRIDEFLAWVERCARQTRLANAPGVVRWNTDKHYLADLARTGVPVVPTRFVEPASDAGAALAAFLAAGPDALSVGMPVRFAEFVVKPSIGAGSRDTARYRCEDAARARAHLGRLVESGRSAMLQPYLPHVDEHGETAVIYLRGRYSHAIRKGPLLRVGDPLVAGLFAAEQIEAREPDAAERQVAAAAFGAIPFDPPLYARIDLIREPGGAPVVLELELTEPSMFFAHAPGAAARLAAAIMDT